MKILKLSNKLYEDMARMIISDNNIGFPYLSKYQIKRFISDACNHLDIDSPEYDDENPRWWIMSTFLQDIDESDMSDEFLAYCLNEYLHECCESTEQYNDLATKISMLWNTKIKNTGFTITSQNDTYVVHDKDVDPKTMNDQHLDYDHKLMHLFGIGDDAPKFNSAKKLSRQYGYMLITSDLNNLSSKSDLFKFYELVDQGGLFIFDLSANYSNYFFMLGYCVSKGAKVALLAEANNNKYIPKIYNVEQYQYNNSSSFEFSLAKIIKATTLK